MNRIVILDNEAVQALLSLGHSKHARVVARFDEITARTMRAGRTRHERKPTTVVVPTSVRVEAGWDRTSPSASLANGLGIADVLLDGDDANVAAALRQQLGTGVSIADAHVGATIARYGGRHITVFTSDPRDIRAVAGSTPVNIVTV